MSWWAVAVGMVVVWLGYNCSFGEGYPDQDLVVRLPGQPKVGFRQFSGYVDVDLKNGRSLFYYYVEAVKQPDTKPLTLWLNGGIMSFVALFFYLNCLHNSYVFKLIHIKMKLWFVLQAQVVLRLAEELSLSWVHFTQQAMVVASGLTPCLGTKVSFL